LPDPALLAQGRRWRAAAAGRPIVLAASWREGEDAPLLSAWAAQRAGCASAPLLVLVPRHPQRFDEVAALVQAAGLRLVRRSTWRDGAGPVGADPPPDGPTADAAEADVWLGDSMREMPAYYALADVALLGGSYAPLGGQNLIEAASCGCPVVMGPHTFNFAEASQLAQAQGAARRVESLDAGVVEALRLASQPDAQATVATAARAYAAAHQGAARRMAARIVALMTR
jgi:3-deoxy-D-manno-octulosonic-acid transferase